MKTMFFFFFYRRIPVKKNWSNPKSQVSSPGSTQSFDTTPNWRMESLIRDSDSDLSNDDEFFDCQGNKRCFYLL